MEFFTRQHKGDSEEEDDNEFEPDKSDQSDYDISDQDEDDLNDNYEVKIPGEGEFVESSSESDSQSENEVDQELETAPVKRTREGKPIVSQIKQSKDIENNKQNETSQKDNSKIADKSDKKDEKASTDAKQAAPKPKVTLAAMNELMKKKLNKPQQQSVIQSTKADWENFKTKQNIADELKVATDAGKMTGKGDGFLERQAFLNRADQRQFEIEKHMRAEQRK
ncbi:MAG: hypothetical protein EZS28_045223, partial [Streblomastix strix]